MTNVTPFYILDSLLKIFYMEFINEVFRSFENSSGTTYSVWFLSKCSKIFDGFLNNAVEVSEFRLYSTRKDHLHIVALVKMIFGSHFPRMKTHVLEHFLLAALHCSMEDDMKVSRMKNVMSLDTLTKWVNV